MTSVAIDPYAAPAVQAQGLLLPIANLGSPATTSTAAIGVAFKAFFMRAICPKSGTLHDIAVFNGATVAGNTNVAVYDTGDTTAGSYTPLWSSGSIAMAGVNAWQVVGDPALSVYAGQQVMLAVMNDGTTAVFGRNAAANQAAMNSLPAGYLPASGGASPKLVATTTFGSLVYAALTEAAMVAAQQPVTIIGRIA